MSEKQFYIFEDNIRGNFGEVDKPLNNTEVVDLLNEQQATIEKQKRVIKSQDAEISRQYNLCLAMSGVLQEEFGVYDVFDRTKDKKEDN